MSDHTQYQAGCSDQYAELCALSTTGELSADELVTLNRHVKTCGPCSDLLREYSSLASVGMARLTAEFQPEPDYHPSYNEKRAQLRLQEALHASRSTTDQPRLHAVVPMPLSSRRGRGYFIRFAGVAAILLISVAGAFELGRRVEMRSPQTTTVPAAQPPVIVPDVEKASLQDKLAAVQKSLADVTARSTEAEKRIEELSNAKTTLLAQIDDLTKRDQATVSTLVATTQQRDALQQQLTDTSKSLQQVSEELSRARQDRQGAMLRAATLEQEVNGLHATLALADKSTPTNEELLAKDRDIRELMGARQLYIADVFDVQNDGERSKPFGRVFYTKGKSLIFYAFDLQAQPGYRETKTFQAWGKPDHPSAKPISLGIFYMDNEKNQRWALKSDDPQVLAQINAVFVTVEPKGGSPRPTGKPFLEAYLHTLPPNHP